MKEKIYNLYLDINDGFIVRLGAVEYECDGSDEDKLTYLTERVIIDQDKIQFFPVPMKFHNQSADGKLIEGILSYRMFEELDWGGESFQVFLEIFKFFDTGECPLVCITPINDGKIIVRRSKLLKSFTFHSAPDYMIKYFSAEGFHFSQLLNDDFFLPIKLLNNNGFYIGAMKLLLSAIDSFAYLAYGETKENIFIKWMNKYVNLDALKIKSEEIWELRNSLLHLTNYESRKVKSGKVNGLRIVAGKDTFVNGENLNYNEFYIIICNAVSIWLEDLLKDPNKIDAFFDRYDAIVSDARTGYLVTEYQNDTIKTEDLW